MDIDWDSSNADREKVIVYVQNKYGYEYVSRIATFQTVKIKALIRRVGKAIGIPYDYCDTLCKNVQDSIFVPGEDEPVPVTKFSQLEQMPYFQDALKDDQVKELFHIASRLEGLPITTGMHAAGVIIGAKPLKEYAALMEVDGVMVTQMEKVNVEELGMLKMDFLGLQTLDVEQNCVELIEEFYHEKVRISEIPDGDKETYELLAQAKTNCVFQLVSPGMKKLLLQLHPSEFEHLNAAVALYRPGPMKYIPVYIANRNSGHIEYPHPLYEKVAKSTYGVLCYQEQVMQILQYIGGFSLGEADIIRRAMSKKKEHDIEAARGKFIQGAMDLHQIPNELANQMFDMVKPFAEYGFNRSHSAAYARISYETAWLKAHYLPAFMAANLTISSSNTDKLRQCLIDTKEEGLTILPPLLGKSRANFVLEPNGDDGFAIRYGYRGIAYIGDDAAEVLASIPESICQDIVQVMEYLLQHHFQSDQLQMLAKAGVFDELVTRSSILSLLQNEEALNRLKYQAMLHARGVESMYQLLGDVFTIPNLPEMDTLRKLHEEKRALSICLSGHVVEKMRREIHKEHLLSLSDIYSQCTCNSPVVESAKENESKEDDLVRVILLVNEVSIIQTKKGQTMAILACEDENYAAKVIVFPKLFEEKRQDLRGNWKGKLIYLEAHVDYKEETGELNLLAHNYEEVSMHTHHMYMSEEQYQQLASMSTHVEGITQVFAIHDGMVRATDLFIDVQAPQYTAFINQNEVYFVE